MTAWLSRSCLAFLLLVLACANPLTPVGEPSDTGSGATTGSNSGTDTTAGGSSSSSDPVTSTGLVDSSGTGSGEPTCGNGMIDDGEACDGKTLPEGITCQTEKDFGKGVPGCSEDCSMIDYSVCPGYGLCGNGEVSFGEECDGEVFANGVMTCDDLPNLTGEGLTCTADCMLDAAACTVCRESEQSCELGQDVCCNEGEICGAGLLATRRCCVPAALTCVR